MQLFRCQACGNVVYFENRGCVRCGHRLGFVADAGTLCALEPAGGANWRPVGGSGAAVRFCANAASDVCNWLLPAGSPDALCLACRHNDTIPNLGNQNHVAAWRTLELAKHRLFYSLLRWRLPLFTRAKDPVHGLAFEFLADPPDAGAPKVMTGHDEGRITIALAEADPAEIERRRAEFDEPYRTVLGHFRHEVGHHYWDVLARGDADHLEAFRNLFGDERQDYAAALTRHYREGAPAGWQDAFVSAYATSHPWEDFAETWAHYLRIVDTLDTAAAFGLSLTPPIARDGEIAARADFDPYAEGDVQAIVEAWAPVSVAMNSINQSMGRADLYPFVLAAPVVAKLGFVHALVRGAASANAGMWDVRRAAE
jgi:hypothetical protein